MYYREENFDKYVQELFTTYKTATDDCLRVNFKKFLVNMYQVHSMKTYLL